VGSVAGKYVRPPAHDRVIIFVNGIFGDGTGTWTNSTTGKYWPALLAADPDFAGVDVYVHSFISPHLSNAQQILELAGRMKDLLETDGVIAKHTELVFLCHSMGGLVTRAFLLNARLPASKTPMIYFFATPTAGANVAGIAAHLSANPQLVDMKPLEDGGYVKNLREQWLQTSNDSALDYPNKIASFCAYELKDTWAFRVVPEISATYLCNHETRGVVGDHLDIVKPADENADQYRFFKAAYDRQFGQEAAPIRTAFAMRRMIPFAAASPELRLGQLRAATVVLKQVKPASQSIDVGCEEEKKGELEAKVDLEPGETVSQVKADIVNGNNLKSSSTAVVRASNGTATVGYTLRGLDRANCPGGGHADVIVNFVVTREPRVLRPEVEVPVRRVSPAILRPGLPVDSVPHARLAATPPSR
jgi:pimeloyl-ACP methyl ester carboxylesterase